MDYETMKNEADRHWSAIETLDTPLIHVGMGTCGLAAGAQQVYDAVEATLKELGTECRIVSVGCIGMCYAEPMIAVRRPGQPFVYYGDLTAESTRDILTRSLRDDDPCPDQALCTRGEDTIEGIPRFEELPMIRHQVRVALRNCGIINPDEIHDYVARGGYAGLRQALQMDPTEVVAELEKSGLRGRGGAGFSTGMKWKFAAQAPGETKHFICNADEGDPGAFMDRSLLEGDPHSVLEGMAIGGYAIGAQHGYVYARAEYPLAIQKLRIAIEQMTERGLLGENILGSGFSFQVLIKEGAGAFVCGEETALIDSIQGARGMPRPRPPFPAQQGLYGQPTNINNVETLSNVSAILGRGAAWYAEHGTDQSKGTKTFSLAGNICRPGLIEVPMGIELGTIIHDIGGGVPGGKKLKAVQTGGPSGGCIPASLLSLPVDYESLAKAGSIMGSGGMVVMDEDTCMVDMARYFLTFTHSESCGKCMPCRLGTGRMLDVLEDICAGRGEPEDLDLLEQLGEAINGAALCGLGQTAPNPVLTTMRYFRDEYEAHVRYKHCPAVACSGLVTAPCQHACPIGTDVPAYVALAGEGRTDDAYRVLLDTNPFPASCARVCDHLCQQKCRRGTLDDAVAIRNLKRYVTDNGTAPPPRVLSPARTERIAIIGAGPAGLSAARELRLRGYDVTVLEALPEAGGMLRYAIPEYRLPKAVLDREIDAILELGVRLETSTRVGKDIPWLQLVDRYDAVFLAVGAQKSAPLRLPGADLTGVQGAVELLREVQLSQAQQVGRQVAVIGGGNSAIDAARTAVRLGADKVRVLYRRREEDMPAQAEEIEAALEEGIDLQTLMAPLELVGEDGKVTGVVCQSMTLGPYDRSGRKTPVPDGSDPITVEADQVVVAIGQATELPFHEHVGGVQVTQRGRVAIRHDSHTATHHAQVFAGGDAVTGPATVVKAIAAGVDAAREIDTSLRNARGEAPYREPPADPVEVPPFADEDIVPGSQQEMPLLSKRDRCRGFAEVELGYTEEQARKEASRCLRCDAQQTDELEETEDQPAREEASARR